jgi:nitrate/nitrite-specific signal transduction histidine kinase
LRTVKKPRLSFKTLKLITIFAPAFLIGGIEVLRHHVFIEKDPMTIGNIVVFVIVLTGSFFFSRFIFGIIERMQRETARRNQELATLNSVALAVNESLELDTVLFRALDKLLETTGAGAGEIFLRDETNPEMRRVVASGLLLDGLHRQPVIAVGEGFAGAVAADGPMVADDVTLERWRLRPELKEHGLDFAVGVPLRSKNSVTGVIVLAAPAARRFTPEDIELLSSIGNQISVAIENARLHEKVQSLATLEERERIAREIHDGLAQVLSFVTTKTQATRQLLVTGQQDAAVTSLKELEEIARDSYADVREAIMGLRSTDLLRKGIVSTLNEYILRYSQLSGVKTTLEVSDGAARSLPADAQLQVIRIVQESLTNVRKHAQASHAWVRIAARDGRTVITIEDDGRGFEPGRVKEENRLKFGLETMKERAEIIKGKIDITSAPGARTRVTLTVPAAAAEEKYESVTG